MPSRVYETGGRPSVCPSHHSPAACGGFAAERKAGGKYRSTAAGTTASGAVQHGARGVARKKEVGDARNETKIFFNKLGLHTRTLMHVRKIATADLWCCPEIQLLVFECL